MLRKQISRARKLRSVNSVGDPREVSCLSSLFPKFLLLSPVHWTLQCPVVHRASWPAVLCRASVRCWFLSFVSTVHGRTICSSAVNQNRRAGYTVLQHGCKMPAVQSSATPASAQPRSHPWHRRVLTQHPPSVPVPSTFPPRDGSYTA